MVKFRHLRNPFELLPQKIVSVGNLIEFFPYTTLRTVSVFMYELKLAFLAKCLKQLLTLKVPEIREINLVEVD